MKFAEINAIFTSKVASLIGSGYIFNTSTMSGSQGEIAHVDLRKENDVLRVLLVSDHDHDTFMSRIIFIVGRCHDQSVIAIKDYRDYATIWNSQLEIIEEKVFWKMENHRNVDWYVEGDEGKIAAQKHSDRAYARFSGNSSAKHEFPGKEKLVLPLVRRLLNKGRYPVQNIKRVYKYWSYDKKRNFYCAETTTKGTVILN